MGPALRRLRRGRWSATLRRGRSPAAAGKRLTMAAAPRTGRHSPHHFPPGAVWTDAFTVSRVGESNSPPPPPPPRSASPHRLIEAVALLCSGPYPRCGTAIPPDEPRKGWGSESELGPRRGPRHGVALRRHARDRLRRRPAEARRALRAHTLRCGTPRALALHRSGRGRLQACSGAVRGSRAS